ncbi:NADH-quinone oxidoreductase subunit NuoH [Candidatus Borrarchaeum sp.]|uniref:NADH-quinone oxidoreductase subunit NuoH n=1 Tax=Candidatus Borrarchaeum sp. TaxID=2846742 RepID=UPI002580AA03|nr:NADH-quinone oxidoreductase subunit NuoH [Candidatus Borrarchaeum sp.]
MNIVNNIENIINSIQIAELRQLLMFIFGVLQSELFFKILLFPGIFTILITVSELIWLERKFLAKMQLRVGPQYAGRIAGILQPIADFVKLLFKETIIPEKADKKFFQIVPIILVVLAATTLTVIPLSETAVISNLDVSLLFTFAILAMFPILTLLAGWASNSKYPFLGGIRALFQQISYEVPLWFSTLGVVLLAESLNFVSIVKAQSTFWFILLLPLGALVFIISMIAELERIPFDLPEAESEIVMGWMTEYSGMTFGLIMLSLYTKVYFASAMFTALFLGGWIGPSFMYPAFWFLTKTLIVALIIIALRGVLPRVRLSDLLEIGWRRLLILSFVSIIWAVAVKLILLGVL